MRFQASARNIINITLRQFTLNFQFKFSFNHLIFVSIYIIVQWYNH